MCHILGGCKFRIIAFICRYGCSPVDCGGSNQAWGNGSSRCLVGACHLAVPSNKLRYSQRTAVQEANVSGSLPINSSPLIPPKVHTVPLKCYDRDTRITNSPYTFCDKMALSLCSESVEEVSSGGMEHTVLMYTSTTHTHALSSTHSHHPPQFTHTSLGLQNYTSETHLLWTQPLDKTA